MQSFLHQARLRRGFGSSPLHWHKGMKPVFPILLSSFSPGKIWKVPPQLPGPFSLCASCHQEPGLIPGYNNIEARRTSRQKRSRRFILLLGKQGFSL
jgi:hypothetical protein